MKIFAHRGSSENYPENTLLAFKKAIEINVDGIETDIRLSRDNEVIIFHDDTLERLVGLKSASEDLTLLELKKLDIGQGEQIPTLEELLQLVNAKATIILEIKYNPSTYKNLCKLVAKNIKELLSWVEVSCFDDEVLDYMYKLNPDIKLHKLIEDIEVLKDKNFEQKYHYASYLDIDIKLRHLVMNLRLFDKYKIIFWTVDREDITKEKEAGLYGIMKNNPRI